MFYPVRARLLGAALLLAAPGAATAADPPPWPVGLYNPRPLADDVILPLPCAGALSFRPVATPAGSPRTALVGPFSALAGTGQRTLLIGKYEVTVLQYQAVTASAAGRPCPAVPSVGNVQAINALAAAQVGVSRIDAVNFAAQLSRWLHANAAQIPPCAPGSKPCLPRVEGKPAFVRLPLDVEWEYAARGGAQVADDVFAARRYPMPEGLERHAWYNRNADGEIAPIGQRLPNPLGLHDLYGNAWEIMNDPYSSAQFPGQIGGDVLMGGGIHSSDEDLRADARLEVQPYDAAGDVKTADTGFRVVLAAPVVTSVGRRSAPPAPAPASAGVADGRLRIEVDAYALVLLDGELQGSFGVGRPLELTGLRRGKHRIEVSPLVPGYAKAAATVDLTDGEPVNVQIHLEPPPGRADSPPELTPDERRRVRQQLSELGYPCDGASDRFDRAFTVVLRDFQRQSGLPMTGQLTAETRILLERRSAEQRQLARPSARSAADAPPRRPGGYIPQFPDRARDERWMDPATP
ncbi:SUMF1/EgtB/PvdO family nonheme iron enzyme [uncultured Thiodictyon sp.]|uniref:SUMF1/EgtB/PvdO family nonheme iron enzyme n=1 Tax=uncultured Thiodictyon sp. TaxID=1846217 RepID=UPI0025CFE04A|nr:SUMF1/EgtB/PvdO family nonheme iron enzyme [uncultured Thiodictyon sp.]